MDLLEFATLINTMINDLQTNRQSESVLIATESVALVRLRVQNSKQDSDGQSFGQYSQAKVPKWFFKGKSLSNGAEDRVKKAPFFISYAEFRDLNNLPSDDINFTFSGDMWRNVGVTNVEDETDITSVDIGGQTTRSKELLGYHNDRFGNILELNEQEIQFIVDSHEERIFNTIQKYLL